MIPQENKKGASPDDVARGEDSRKLVVSVTVGGTLLVVDPTKTRVMTYKDGTTSTTYFDASGNFCGEA
jgi:hypothetical protein